MMLKDYAPYVCMVLVRDGMSNQTELTEQVWGTSGRNSPRLTKNLFPAMVDWGYLKLEKWGRTKMYSVTDKGKELAKEAVFMERI